MGNVGDYDEQAPRFSPGLNLLKVLDGLGVHVNTKPTLRKILEGLGFEAPSRNLVSTVQPIPDNLGITLDDPAV